MSFNVFNLSEAAANPFNFCIRLIEISIGYRILVVSAGFFVFMARIQFPHKSSALTTSFSVRQPPNAPFVLSCPPTAPRLPCGCRRRCKGFLSPFSSHRTDGLFLRKMSVSRSPCSSPCFQFPRRQCLLQYLAEQVKQPACNLPRLAPAVLALFPVCQARLLHVKKLCPGTVDSQSAAQLKGSGCSRSAVPAVSDS